MDQIDWRTPRIFLWWGAGLACVTALIAGNGALLRGSVVALVLIGTAALSLACFEHGWNKDGQGDASIGKSLSILCLAALPMCFVGREVLPKEEVAKFKPSVYWVPAPLREGDHLSSMQLNASAMVDGKSIDIEEPVYNPTFGETLSAGTRTLGVKIIPRDSSRYLPVEWTVSVDVEPSDNQPLDLPTQNRFGELKSQTNGLAKQLLDFVYSRQGKRYDLEQKLIAQSFIDAINRNPAGQAILQGQLQSWNEETASQFRTVYLPQITALISELQDAGTDVSPITRAFGANNQLKLGLMLSSVSDRIGKKPPYPRVLTEDQAENIVRQVGAYGYVMEVYSAPDRSSKEIANILYREAKRQGIHVTGSVEQLSLNQAPLSGIHIVFPSADVEVGFQFFIEALKDCELETRVDLRSKPQPPTIIKLEIWPSKHPSDVPEPGPPFPVVNPGPVIKPQ